MVKVWITVVIGLIAIAEDVTRRRISNWIPIAACLAGICLQVADKGWQGLLAWMAGLLTGGAVFLIFYLLGGMGGGDIKLMAGFGSILGAEGVLEASLWTAGCGGVLAVIVIGLNTIKRVWSGRRLRQQGDASDGSAEANRVDSIPYAPAIAAGVWLSLVGKV